MFKFLLFLITIFVSLKRTMSSCDTHCRSDMNCNHVCKIDAKLKEGRNCVALCDPQTAKCMRNIPRRDEMGVAKLQCDIDCIKRHHCDWLCESHNGTKIKDCSVHCKDHKCHPNKVKVYDPSSASTFKTSVLHVCFLYIFITLFV